MTRLNYSLAFLVLTWFAYQQWTLYDTYLSLDVASHQLTWHYLLSIVIFSKTQAHNMLDLITYSYTALNPAFQAKRLRTLYQSL